jgi:hypothetical protein
MVNVSEDPSCHAFVIGAQVMLTWIDPAASVVDGLARHCESTVDWHRCSALRISASGAGGAGHAIRR